ncbi:MAG TPA: DUF4440 domain-containing protein [Solirubrobacteraceae bacterium]|nr:DUF4440 domain-containing protein [Solirubrobacteraceae bacterium]
MTVAQVDACARAFEAGVADRDAGAIADLYHEDARFLIPNAEPCEGREATRAAWQQLLDVGADSLKLEPIEVREAGELTIEYGLYTLRIEAEGAEAMTDTGTYVVVDEARQDGSSKLSLYIFNSNLPARGGPLG